MGQFICIFSYCSFLSTPKSYLLVAKSW